MEIKLPMFYFSHCPAIQLKLITLGYSPLLILGSACSTQQDFIVLFTNYIER